MKKILSNILFLISLTVPVCGMTVEEVLDNTNDNFKNKITVFQADIEQVMSISGMQEAETMKGTITLKKPDNVYIDYTEPNKQSIISNGKNIWLYFPNAKQVIVQDAVEAKPKGNLLLEFGSFVENMKRDYEIKLIREGEFDSKQAGLLQLKPKKENAEFLKIYMWIEKDKWLPLKVTVFLIDEISNISITFKNIKLNEEIKKDMFDFKPPEGSEIIISPLN